ncbi:MAG: DMT family transporter [Pseudomonadota bacterium]
MRTAGLTLAALVAFAANSVLCRAALLGGAIDPASFTAVRVISGVAALAALLAFRPGAGQALRQARIVPGLALLIYAAFFSFAYVSLDAGVGALILFGTVQVAMLAGAVFGGERPAPARWLGAALGLGGLGWLTLPGADAPPLFGAALMVTAGLGWAVYSLLGRGARDPLADTFGAFLAAAPLAAAIWLAAGLPMMVEAEGLALAIVSGALASGCGYAIWYAALPRLDASIAAVSQLTVPLIALAGGIVFLGESAGPRVWTAAALILGGVGLATLLTRRKAQPGR